MITNLKPNESSSRRMPKELDSPKMTRHAFKVIIVGGSVSGLTLGHCLDQAGIDYVILEKHRDICPQIGASVSIMPNGGRILEQLGLVDDVESLSQPYQYAHLYFHKKYLLISEEPALIARKHGIPLGCLERRQLLEALYTKLKDKSRVHVCKKVTTVSSQEPGIAVHTEDGAIYHGDVVVGADGVHSVIRSEMWRIADLRQPGLITNHEKRSVCAEYSCVYGISNPVTGIKRWQHVVRFNQGYSILIFPAIGSTIFWTIIKKLDRKYVYPDIPRFNDQNATVLCESLSDVPIWQHVRFGDIWTQKRSFGMIALEEGLLQTWHYGRIVCIGDSVSKMTPNMGQGANTAIESAAGLSNEIRRLLDKSPIAHPSEPEIKDMFDRFNRSQLKRLSRIHRDSRLVTRAEAYDGVLMTIVAYYISPFCGDIFAKWVVKHTKEGVILDYVPSRSGKYWHFSPKTETWGITKLNTLVLKVDGSILVLIAVAVILSWLIDLVSSWNGSGFIKDML